MNIEKRRRKVSVKDSTLVGIVFDRTSWSEVFPRVALVADAAKSIHSEQRAGGILCVAF